jgi:hypothetical protein
MIRNWFLSALSILSCVVAIVGKATDVPDIPGKGDHPPELTHVFTGTVQHIDATTLLISRPHETHTFLLTNCRAAHRVNVPANALHRPVEVTCSGNGDPYCALKVKVLASLPEPTPKEEQTPTYYLTGVIRGLEGEQDLLKHTNYGHLTVQSGQSTHVFVVDALTMYYDQEGYIMLSPHPNVDLRRARRVKVGYTGRREPYHTVSVEFLR